jgi:hypothetical protein
MSSLRVLITGSREWQLDGEDCLELLYELGLLEDPQAKPRRKGRA